MRDTITFVVRIPRSLRKQMKLHAAQKEVTLTHLTIEALKSYIDERSNDGE